MKSFFGRVTALSLRFRWITLILAAVVSVAGVYAVTQLQLELIPSVSFPQTIVLSQVSGMSSEQVLGVLTKRLEETIAQVPEVVNVESQTTGSFGAVITARNDFGQNQAAIQRDIQAALDTVWLPTRQIAPPEGADSLEFAAQLLADVPAELLIYLANDDPNFLFQLNTDVWAALSDDTVAGVLTWLAAQTQAQTGAGGALRQLIDQEIAPLLDNLPEIASVSVSGGQLLPGETGDTAAPAAVREASLLLNLSPEVWAVAAPKAGFDGARDESAVAFFSGESGVPESAPALPASWQMDRFVDASDLLEMVSLTRTLGTVFNDFAATGRIHGPLGQTNDLTPEVITEMLAIEPTMVDFFQAEHLAAMTPEVFAALPPEFIAGLDGLTRDELAARGLAAAITGQDADPAPVDLPSPWRISPPQIISFSLDDLPLASFAISGAVDASAETPAGGVAETPTEATPEPTAAPTATPAPPVGPSLPLPFSLIGTALGMELNTADDLIEVTLPENMAAQFGAGTLSGAQLLSFLMLLNDTDSLPEGVEMPAIPIDPVALIGLISPEAIQFLADNDPTFVSSLDPAVFNAFSDAVLALDAIAPPLDTVWNTLAGQPQFADQPLRTAADVVALGNGSPSAALNAINEGVPADFAGYEVRLFNSLTPATLRYFVLREPDFMTNVSTDVLLKLAPETIAALPPELLAPLSDDLNTQLAAIASGETPSAAEALAALYATDVPPADPNAPPLNADWQIIGDFIGVELDTADDFSRFFPDTTAFLNDLFNSAAGAGFAPNLFGGLSADALLYMAEQSPDLLDNLRYEALVLLSDETMAALPAAVQERAVSNEAPFVPTDTVTRVNGASSLLVTLYLSDGANTVDAFHNAEAALREFAANHSGNLTVTVAFEQASFIEESISGVAREGGLGAIFAIIVILIFLSAGFWSRRGRLITGGIMVVGFLVALVAVVAGSAGNYGGDLGLGWHNADVIVRGLLLLGAGAGLFFMAWPGRVARPAWRSTFVTAVSIPLSILMAFMLMNWLPPTVNGLLAPSAEGSDILSFLLRLFPASITLNIMTLSGFTVAIGRVVDDSIVVLENMFRHVSEGGDKRTAIIQATKEVSVAIFAATVITVVVFLPLGLTGGIIGEFFLPFGLAVTYALMSSFVVAITVVPVVAYLMLDQSEMSAEGHEGKLERAYNPILRWALARPSHGFAVLGIAAGSLVLGVLVMTSLPTAFLPALGEPQIGVTVSMPPGTRILETNTLVTQLEDAIANELPEGEISRVQTVLGSSGMDLQSLFLGGSSVDETLASVTVAVENPDRLDALTADIRAIAERIFGEQNVTVSAASLTEQGLGGFALVLSGPQEDLAAVNQDVIDTLNAVDGLTNVQSNLAGLTGETSGDAPVTFIRIDGESAVRFTGELETEDTLGVTGAAKTAVMAMPNLPDTITVSEGFESRLQTEGFANLFVAMAIAIAIVIVLLMITFGSLVHWLDIMLSVIVAPMGAAVALALSNRVLGISAMIGMLMLIGIVVTNAVVLIDRVRSNQYQRHMNTGDALLEAGNRRLRPILMTAIATICALIPLAIGLSQGAIIASELGTVVIGGLFSSTLLTLIVVPVAYKLLDPLDRWTRKLFRRS